jgi:tetratricopeptide (TPR) repeat protein
LYRQRGGLDAAISVFESAVGVGVACLPEKFQAGVDLIAWYWEDNWAFLLACEYLAACHLESALNFYEYSLKVNPDYRAIDKLVEQLREVCKSRGIVE